MFINVTVITFSGRGNEVKEQLTLSAVAARIEGSQEDKLRIHLLIFACAFMNFAVMFWLAIYWLMGQDFSTNVPLAYQAVSVSSLIYYLKTRNFEAFRFIQLSLFLFAPFVMQWSVGSSVTSSGVTIWALLAPIGAVVVAGWRESIPWFVAYIVLTAVSGFFDYFLGVGNTGGLALKTIGVFFALNFVAMSSILYFLVRYFVLETEKIKMQLDQQHVLLLEEQKKSEQLLLNVLPVHIAQRLKDSSSLIADGHADVTVMFADISNFTQMTEKMVPTQMVGMLNKVFSWFDAMTDKHGLEKIKTIGDAYMVVGGLIRNRDDYVKNIVDMALEIRDLISTHPELARHNIGIHIGIATGPAVAGVLGSKRFIYDVWGDAVNVASRLADEGKQGEILTDKVTYNRLRNQYTFSPPIMVELKGKGELTVYSLKGRSNSSSER
jgi:adenylate cyclase